MPPQRVDHPRFAAWVGAAGGAEPAAAIGGRHVWVEAQLLPALSRWLAQEYGVDAAHVNDVGYLRADDMVILDAARRGAVAVVVTKDVDFVQLVERHGAPPQVVWVTRGNVRHAVLRAAVLSVWPRIAAALAAGEPLVELG